jgi:hypothetical protein
MNIGSEAGKTWSWSLIHLAPRIRLSGSIPLLFHASLWSAQDEHYLTGTCLHFHCATNQRVAGSIPDSAIRIFLWRNPSGRTVALRSTRPLTEVSTCNVFLGGKGGRCVGVTTLPPLCADFCYEIWEPQSPEILRVCSGLYRDCFTLLYQSQGWAGAI